MRSVSLVLFAMSVLMRAPGATSELADPSSVQLGDEICFEGFVMDDFCIQLGRLMDNPDVVTLEGPDKHSVHCLIDIDECRESSYILLSEPMMEGELYTQAFLVNDAGQQLLIDIARDVGSCSTCTGNGDLQKGFRVQVLGTVTALGDGDIPPTIEVADAVPSNSMATVCNGTESRSPVLTDDSDKPSSGVAEQGFHGYDSAIKMLGAISAVWFLQ